MPLPDAAQPGFPNGGARPFHRADVTIAWPLDAIGTDLAALMTITGGIYTARG